MKYAWIRSNLQLAPLTMMCGALGVSRSGYNDWRRRMPSRRDNDDRNHLKLIKDGFKKGESCYGTRRLKRELAADGVVLSRRRIGRLMKSAGLECKTRKKRKPQTTDSSHDKPIAENLLNREFDVPATDQVYVGDITYIDTEEGWLYLAVWIDLCSRAVVGWSMQKHMRAELVCDALRMAMGSRYCTQGLIVHSDRGSQYASEKFRKLLAERKFIASMSAKGDCWDNAVAESFFHTLKTERVYGQKYATREEAKRDIFEYIEAYYNRVRRHSTSDYLAPLEYEKQLQGAV